MNPRVRISRILVSTRVFLAAAAISATSAAPAAEVAEMAAEAEDLLRSGQPDAAFEVLDAAVDAFWKEAPLTVANAYIVADGTDRILPAAPASPVFASGERVAIHVEPLGYLFYKDGEDFRINLSTAVEIRTRGGLILAESDDFAHLEWVGPGKNRAFSGRISLALPDLKPGDYQLTLTLNDGASQKSAEVTLPFKVAAE